MKTFERTITALLLCAAAAPVTSQNLRRGIQDATTIVVARSLGLQPLGNELFIHRYETLETLTGDSAARFSIIERKRVADTPKPKPGAKRLMCLRDDRTLELPARYAPYMRPTGYTGDMPLLGDDRASRSLRQLADVLVASRDGASSKQTAPALVEIALRGHGIARVEACESMRERQMLREALGAVQLDSLLLRAVGETDDVSLKIAMASLCAEAGAKNVTGPLCMSLREVHDPRFARALGRIAKHLHGEQACEVLQQYVRNEKGPTRDAALLALGATATDAAFKTLSSMHKRGEASPAVEAALRAHGSRRARALLKTTPEDAVHRREPGKSK